MFIALCSTLNAQCSMLNALFSMLFSQSPISKDPTQECPVKGLEAFGFISANLWEKM